MAQSLSQVMAENQDLKKLIFSGRTQDESEAMSILSNLTLPPTLEDYTLYINESVSPERSLESIPSNQYFAPLFRISGLRALRLYLRTPLHGTPTQDLIKVIKNNPYLETLQINLAFRPIATIIMDFMKLAKTISESKIKNIIFVARSDYHSWNNQNNLSPFLSTLQQRNRSYNTLQIKFSNTLNATNDILFFNGTSVLTMD